MRSDQTRTLEELTTPMEYNGKRYYTVKQFAFMTNRSTQAIYRLINRGNAIRQLKADYILDHPMIPVEEYDEFPFSGPGVQGRYDIQRFGKGKDNADVYP